MIPLAWIYWDPKPEIFVLPIVHWPILWYGLFFAFGFVVGFPIFVGVVTRYLRFRYPEQTILQCKGKATQVADRLTIYIVIATVLGSRLGHFFFYESPSSYLNDPLQIFRVWEGGLASHGAVIAIILAVFLFSYRIRSVIKGLSWMRVLDFLSAPAAFAACCIRIGNFFNQEIFGTPSNLPWAVVFGHPADHSMPTPRHPVQLYESLFYLAVFFLLWRLSFRSKFLAVQGKLTGLCLALIFGFRFFIEFLKP